MRSCLTLLCLCGALLALASPGRAQDRPTAPPDQQDAPGFQDPNNPFIQDPVLTATRRVDVRLPKTYQVAPPSEQVNVVGQIVRGDATGRRSLRGRTVMRVESPNRDLRDRAREMSEAAGNGDTAAMAAAAQSVVDILQGTTEGAIYDGFALLNYNRGAFADGQESGEYKLKTLADSGLTVEGLDGENRRIWEVTVNLLWYDEQFDSDTHFLRVPAAAHPLDELRVHYRIYSLEREDFSPTSLLRDHRAQGSESLPFLGFDSVWIAVDADSVTELSVQHPPLQYLEGISIWGRRAQPSALASVRLVREIVNAHTGELELDPEGKSLVKRNRGLALADIGDAAPEKKLWTVAQAALAGAPPSQIFAACENAGAGPAGTLDSWTDLMEAHTVLPPEAWEVLAQEGLGQGDFGEYDYVAVFLNNEMYGAGPAGSVLTPYAQGERLNLKLINLDACPHYFQAWDNGVKLGISFRYCDTAPGGGNSLEIMSYKPLFGAPKTYELQWRAGWGFRAHHDVIPQQDVFPLPRDRFALRGYADGHGRSRGGWQYSADLRGGDFVFDPPPEVIGSEAAPAPGPLLEAGGSQGLVIGQLTTGYGTAKMCAHADHPPGEYCERDLSGVHPGALRNVDLDSDGSDDVLWFPPYLRNPNPAGGDLIPRTPEWEPFLWIHPGNGTLLMQPGNPAMGYWADATFAHGARIAPGGQLNALIEAPRSSGQVLYLADGLHQDNAALALHREDAP